MKAFFGLCQTCLLLLWPNNSIFDSSVQSTLFQDILVFDYMLTGGKMVVLFRQQRLLLEHLLWRSKSCNCFLFVDAWTLTPTAARLTSWSYDTIMGFLDTSFCIRQFALGLDLKSRKVLDKLAVVWNLHILGYINTMPLNTAMFLKQSTFTWICEND